jgi:hypothetical protein
MLKKLAVAMVAAGGLMVAAVPAHAAGHVSLSVGLPLPIPGVYAAPAPAYYGPPPVVYDAPPVVYGPPAYPYYGYYGPGYYGPRVVYRGGGYYHGGYYAHGGGHWHR